LSARRAFHVVIIYAPADDTLATLPDTRVRYIDARKEMMMLKSETSARYAARVCASSARARYVAGAGSRPAGRRE